MKKLTKKQMWEFAIGQLGWSILSGIIVNWLVYFYQPSQDMIQQGQTVFIPQGKVIFGILTILGLIAALGRIVDAVIDPFLASKSDSCKSKDGRRIPFMRAGALPFALITVLVFCAPINGESLINGVWIAVTSILFYICMSIYCTAYNALIPELGKSQNDRINISTYISVTFFLGTAVAYLCPNIWGIFVPALGRINAIRLTFGIMSVIAFICMMMPVLRIKETDYAQTKPSESGPIESLKKTFKNKEFRTFMLSDILYWIALTIFQTGLPFYVTVLMNLGENMNFILYALMTGLSLVFYAPINILAKKIGKKKLVVFAFIFFAVTFMITSFAGIIGIPGIVYGIVISVMASISMAVLGILPQAIIADIAEYDGISTLENREGMFYAARTFSTALGQSLAMVLFTTIATLGKLPGDGYRYTAIVAAIFCLVSGIVLMKYNEKKVYEVLGVKK